LSTRVSPPCTVYACPNRPRDTPKKRWNHRYRRSFSAECCTNSTHVAAEAGRKVILSAAMLRGPFLALFLWTTRSRFRLEFSEKHRGSRDSAADPRCRRYQGMEYTPRRRIHRDRGAIRQAHSARPPTETP